MEPQPSAARPGPEEQRPSIKISKAIFELQSRLLDLRRCSERQLVAAGSLLSLRDYDDVVTERSLSRLCGSPLCPNPLPPSPPRHGRYRIALREHRVYDLHDAFRFCSDSCRVASKAFASTLHPDRWPGPAASRVAEILRLFQEDDPDPDPLTPSISAGLSQLTIHENCSGSNAGTKMEQWTGPPDAIEGYVPRGKHKQGIESKQGVNSASKTRPVNSTRSCEQFTSEIIIDNALPEVWEDDKLCTISSIIDNALSEVLEKEKSCAISSARDNADLTDAVEKMKSCSISPLGDAISADTKKLDDGGGMKRGLQVEELKSSLKKPGSKTVKGTVKWAAEEQIKVPDTGDLKQKLKEGLPFTSDLDYERSLRVASAEACADALIKASEAVASGECEVEDAVNEAGIVILRPAQEVEIDTDSEDEVLAYERSYERWPRKPVLLDTDEFDVQDSLHDAPPEDFILTLRLHFQKLTNLGDISMSQLSPFMTMWNALFEWVTCSSVASIYGKSGDSADELLFDDRVNYLQKVTLNDGRSSEIKMTLAGCISRALPQVVSSLMLPIPISTMEKAVGLLLDTMTFTEAIPSFKTREWHVIVLLFLDAISVFRIPTLAAHLASKKALMQKMIDAAGIRRDEYELMKDRMISLGRLPQFSVRSGA